MREFIAERPTLQRLLNWATMLLVVCTLLLLANTLANVEFQRGDGLFDLLEDILALFTKRSAPEPIIFPPQFWDILAAGFWLLFLIAVGYIIFTKDGRREIPNLVKILVRGLILALIILLGFQLGNGQPEDSQTEPEIGGERADLLFDDYESPALAEQLEEVIIELPEYPSTNAALIVAGILLATSLFVFIWRWWRHQQELKAISEVPIDELRLRALQTLRDIRQGDAPLADLIRRCYREMVQTVQEQRGVYRHQDVTPREFELRLIKSGFSEPPVQRLTRLFEEARYGNINAGEREKRQAIDSLEQIVEACERLGRKGQPR